MIAAIVAQSSQVDIGHGYTILEPLLMAVATAAATVITAAGALAAAWLKKKLNLTDDEATLLGLQMDAQHRQALQTALTNAAGIALNKIGNDLQGKTVDVKSPAVADAVNVALKAAPQAVAYFGLDKKPDEIAQKIVGKMSQIAVTSGPQAAQ